MEQKQIKYTDCHPRGKPGVRFPLADAHVDPHNIEARRAHMIAFLRHMELYSEKSWAEARASSIAALSMRLHREGFGKVSTSYFELLVDFGVWRCFFKNENPSPSWPWMVPPQRDDLTQGASPLYAAWLKDQVKQEASKKPEAPNDPATIVAEPAEQVVAAHVAEASTASTSALLPAAEIETKTETTATTEAPARVLPPPQVPSSSRWADEMEVDDDPPALPSGVTLSPPLTRRNGGQWFAPKEPSRSKRLDIWLALNRSDHWVAPICGPFEVLLPEWMDFGALVWGPEGAHFAHMHKELIDEDLVVTWATENGVPKRLIVGFRDDDEGSRTPLCKMDRLGFLFTRVTNWVDDVYDGSTQSLLSHLSLSRNTANESMYQPLKPGSRLCLAWEESRKRQ
ncbi:hypothetical protein CEP54_007063 [Fusarium duplospermum]|uniref:Uncharacterized protein n=1 Tax=Fusarium duplospermum TaxID=1325734 RepID=A0A428Q3Q3_9HYPO|nr:hypothetical protein CEP54_007063 [Fusarium duplospermum]